MSTSIHTTIQGTSVRSQRTSDFFFDKGKFQLNNYLIMFLKTMILIFLEGRTDYFTWKLWLMLFDSISIEFSIILLIWAYVFIKPIWICMFLCFPPHLSLFHIQRRAGIYKLAPTKLHWKNSYKASIEVINIIIKLKIHLTFIF